MELVLILAHRGAIDVCEQFAEEFNEVGLRNPNVEEKVQRPLEVLRFECEEAAKQTVIFGGLEEVRIHVIVRQNTSLH